MTQPHFDPRGAIDLSSLQKPTPAQEKAAAAAAATRASAPDGLIVDMTTESFQTIVESSATVPVVVAIGASRTAIGEKMTPLLEAAAVRYAGRFVLARVDADTQPQIAQAFGIEGVPCAVAVIQGQPLPLFQGAPAPDQVDQVLDQVLAAAAQAGVTGVVAGAGPAQQDPTDVPEPEPELPPLFAKAYEAIEAGDYDTAAAAYQQVLNENPIDKDAKAGLGQVTLMKRLDGVTDPVSDLEKAEAMGPTALDLQLHAADIEMAAGRVGAAFDRLVAVVRATREADREAARKRLLELFELVDPQADEIRAARRNLALALF
ncbi:tetratricopeptide repeat protein [Serinibacter arcticus]|uniref:Thioredoxin domain-containing protein EC-YbbN n=1 Tax=Serinibacter arcticus TaxID=1655435 RepID=A0A4Z1DYT2_9MICO|nr:tetratricopeptide repeat protein [Serinibacter arcticus]TGO03998.1 Thioredoxin domain-containing protein EC-YbbN [Serinibacter arcticus]